MLSYKPGVETEVAIFSVFVHEMSLAGGGADKSRHRGGGEMFFTMKKEDRTCLWRVCLSTGWIISLMLYIVPSSDARLVLPGYLGAARM